MQNPPTGLPVCVVLHRSKLISCTGCPPRSTLSGVISLYFMAVDLRPSSFSPSVALTHSTLPPICSKLTIASIILVTIFGIVEVPAALPAGNAHRGECGRLCGMLWICVPHGWDNWIAPGPTLSVCWRARRDLRGIYVSVFSPSHDVPIKPGNYLLIFSSCIKASFLRPCFVLRTTGPFRLAPAQPSTFNHLRTFVPSCHLQQRSPIGCPLFHFLRVTTEFHLLFKMGIGYLSEVTGEPWCAARAADKVAWRYFWFRGRGLFEVSSVL